MAQHNNILINLSNIKESHPDLRIGQIISNALDMSGIHKDLYYVTDEELAASLKSFQEMVCVSAPDFINNQEGDGDDVRSKDMRRVHIKRVR